jgi:hypothetical protein
MELFFSTNLQHTTQLNRKKSWILMQANGMKSNLFLLKWSGLATDAYGKSFTLALLLADSNPKSKQYNQELPVACSMKVGNCY